MSKRLKTTKSAIVLMIAIVALALYGESGGRVVRVTAAIPDQQLITTAISPDQFIDISGTEIGQSFVIPSSQDSPTYEDGQFVRLNSISVGLRVAQDDDCYRYANDVFVEIRETRYGEDIAESNLVYKYPANDMQSIRVEFSPDTILSADEEYYLVVGRRGSASFAEQLHWTEHNLRGSNESLSYSDVRDLDDIANVGVDDNNDMCISEAREPATIEIGVDLDDYYQGGSSDMFGNDIVSQIEVSYVTRSRVLAIIFNPEIGEVGYSDSVGTVDLFDYDSARLWDIMKFDDWSDDDEIVDNLASDIQSGSMESARVSIETHIVNDWAPHLSGDVSWRDEVGVLRSLTGFTKWGSNTWPCFPHIPEVDNIGINTKRYRRHCYPEIQTEFDYGSMMNVEIRDSMTVSELINNEEVDEVWVLTDPSSTIYESVLLVPNDDDGYPMSVDAIKIDGLNRRVVVMGMTAHDSRGEVALRFTRRAEMAMSAVLDGNLYPSCVVNALDSSKFNEFTRLAYCERAIATTTPGASPAPGSVGYARVPFNAQSINSNNVIGITNVEHSVEYALSDEMKWNTYPDEPVGQFVGEINCQQWGCTDMGYAVWWMNHVPRNRGVVGDLYNNLWAYILRPGEFDAIQGGRYDPTPQF